MAVYTEVSSEQMVSFLAEYDIGSLMNFSGITGGVSNSNYRLQTSQGPYIVTLFEDKTEETDLPYFVELMIFLASNGINCPLPVENKEGTALTVLAGRPCIIVTFLEGTSVSIPQKEHCEEIGRTLAQFHLKAQKFRLHRRDNMGLDKIENYFEQLRDAPETTELNYDTLIQNELEFLKAHLPRKAYEIETNKDISPDEKLPVGVIHADMFPDNVFFLGNKLSGLIDFYFACDDYLVYDLAICLNAWCFETGNGVKFNKNLGKVMLMAYESVRPLGEAEKKNFQLFARKAAMRFFLTRLYDQVHAPQDANVKILDPGVFADRLVFHQGIKTVSEYGFDLSERPQNG